MKNLLKIISLIGLLLTLVPSFFVFTGAISLQTHYTLMAAGMLFWFGTAPFWMKGPSLEE